MWITITDTSNQVTYPRQSFTTIPFALKTPTDDATLGFNAEGKLGLKSLSNFKFTGSDDSEFSFEASPSQDKDLVLNLPTQQGGQGKFLKSSGSGGTTWDAPTGAADMRKTTYDPNQDNIAEKADDAVLLSGKNPSFLHNVDNHTDGSDFKAYLDTDKTKLASVAALANITSSTTVRAAGAMMHSDLTGAGFVRRSAADDSLTIDNLSLIATEANPQLGNLTGAGNWCTSDGSLMNCQEP